MPENRETKLARLALANEKRAWKDQDKAILFGMVREDITVKELTDRFNDRVEHKRTVGAIAFYVKGLHSLGLIKSDSKLALSLGDYTRELAKIKQTARAELIDKVTKRVTRKLLGPKTENENEATPAPEENDADRVKRERASAEKRMRESKYRVEPVPSGFATTKEIGVMFNRSTGWISQLYRNGAPVDRKVVNQVAQTSDYIGKGERVIPVAVYKISDAAKLNAASPVLNGRRIHIPTTTTKPESTAPKPRRGRPSGSKSQSRNGVSIAHAPQAQASSPPAREDRETVMAAVRNGDITMADAVELLKAARKPGL